jgi:hypothetical protein
VDVFEYRTTVEASLDAGRVSADGSTISPGVARSAGLVQLSTLSRRRIGSTPAAAGRVLVLYVGRDDGVLAPLRTTLGGQFAGE